MLGLRRETWASCLEWTTEFKLAKVEVRIWKVEIPRAHARIMACGSQERITTVEARKLMGRPWNIGSDVLETRMEKI